MVQLRLDELALPESNAPGSGDQLAAARASPRATAPHRRQAREPMRDSSSSTRALGNWISFYSRVDRARKQAVGGGPNRSDRLLYAYCARQPKRAAARKERKDQHLSRVFWSHPSDSNRRPADYESAALPAELGWRLLPSAAAHPSLVNSGTAGKHSPLPARTADFSVRAKFGETGKTVQMPVVFA
jgi:hypothetical protein